MKPYTASLPWPPSVNRYWRNVGSRTLLSRAGREYRDAVTIALRGTRPNLTGRLRVSLVAHPPDRRRRDLDNLLKGPLDAMQAAGVYEDDSQIDALSVTRANVEPSGRLAVCIEQLT